MKLKSILKSLDIAMLREIQAFWELPAPPFSDPVAAADGAALSATPNPLPEVVAPSTAAMPCARAAIRIVISTWW